MALGDPLGIIAGAGELPIALAHAVREDGRPVFVLALEGIADAARDRQGRIPACLVCAGRSLKDRSAC